MIVGSLLSEHITESSVGNEAIFPGKESATVASILLGAANLGMNSVLLGALVFLVDLY